MTTKIVTGVIDSATLASFGQAGPTIANVQIANSSYSQIDDTAVSLDGGYIVINGNNFNSNVQVLIDGTTATSVTYVSNTQLRAQVGSASSGSKVVYVVNNDDGSTAIRVNALTYSGTPTWITDTTLPEGDAGSAIAITLSANSDSNISYTVAAGSSLPTGLSLASNGYLSGTVNISTDTTYNFTVVATDAENQDSSKSFSISISTGDSNINDVAALFQTERSTWMADASSQKLDLNVQNNVYPTSFSPYRGSYYSVEFDGSGDYISATATSTAGTGDFTWEGWIYLEASGSQRIFDLGNGLLYTDGNGKLTYYTTGANIVDPNVVTLYKWQHVAVVRISGTTKLYVDGTQVGSDYSDSRNYTSTFIRFGADSVPVQYLSGFMSNVRITIGTGLYTSSFTPSTSPLTTTSQGATASEVEILTCQSNRFIDNSTNGHTITVTGDTAISGRTPFATPTAMESYGSGYFSGSDDRIDTSGISPDPFSVGTGDYCFEMWMYVEQLIGTYIPVYIGGVGRLSFLITTNGTNFQVANYGYSGVVNITGNFVFKAWNHVAFTRDNGYVRIFHNGVQIGSDTAESTNWSSSGFVIGANHVGTSDELQGYIADARVVVGSPVYTSNFSVPTAPLSAITNTKLLILQNSYPHTNKLIVERSGINTPLENNGEINISSFSPYSPFGYSNFFDGTGDYLVVPANNDFLFDAGDFTIEAWIHPNVTGTQIGIVNNWQTGGAFQFYILNTNKLYFMFTHVSSGASSVNWTSTDTISPNVWTHVALVRSGSNLYFYINGTLDSGGAQSITQTMYYYNGAAKDLKIGTAGDTGSLWNGYISNLRIIKGVGLYTSNFTPSTTGLTPTDETVLLTCQSPSFIDNGKKKHTLTRYGDARVTPFSPLKGYTTTPDTYSAYLNSYTDYVEVESHTFDMSGEFTIECWVHPINMPSQSWGVADARSSGGTNAYWVLGLRNSSSAFVIEFFAASGAGYVIRGDGTTAIPLDEWSHIALTRNSSNVVTAWVNGVSQGTVTNSTNWTVSNSNLRVGQSKDAASGSYESKGAISNFRFATTCLYTTAFTPSTTPLTAVSGTQLLTFQDATIKDNSSNGLTFSTVNGKIQPQEFNQFGITATSGVQYSPTTHGGSMYGDGTTDYVDVPANAWNSLGTGDFCIQFWTYSKEVDANKGQIAIGGNKISIRFDSSNRMTFWVAGNGGPSSTPNNTVYPFNWYHVCLERSGSTNTLYINGVKQAFNTTTPSNDATPIIRIGGQYGDNTGYTFTGWISDLSIRSKAVYKGNFTPPKQVTYGDQTKLQVPFGDAAVYDSKGQLTYEINSLRVSNKAGKFNDQSLKFAGVNDYVYTEERHGTTKVYGNQLKLGQKDFTIEFWVNFASVSGRQDLLWIGSGGTRLGILYNLTSTHLTYYNSSTSAISANPSFSTDTWYHIALCRASGSTKLFVDGTQLGSTYVDSVNYDGTILYLGKDSGASSQYFNGYMDGLRITRYARYTSNFTAPGGAFKAK